MPLSITDFNISSNSKSNCPLSLAGIICSKFNAYSVQYHPEASPGPNDAHYLFNYFIEMMDKEHAQKN